jgi:hypothetical protein
VADWILEPRLSDLISEPVLVHAWKKAHTYIRNHNWFEDALDLDFSTLFLQKQVEEWQAALREHESFGPDSIRLVPAPKAGPWHIRADKWRPKNGARAVNLRPLAHVSVRDQALALGFMMCLADYVETAQGDPRLKLPEARRLGVVSYGNRLFCDSRRNNRQLRFRWGNSGVYRKYFQDYRAFIERPKEVIRLDFPNRSDWVEVRIDLSQFYDRVKIADLVPKVRGIVGPAAGEEFMHAFEQLFCWKWHKADQSICRRYSSLCSPPLHDFATICLPQGLVASGFFANAFMYDFDRAMWLGTRQGRPAGEWQIVDYSRYVDDMRLVIDLNGYQDRALFQRAVIELVENTLRQHAPGQYVNTDKIEFVFGETPAKLEFVSDRIRVVQTNISGPLDVPTARDTLGMLDALLASKADTAPEFEDASDVGQQLRAIFATQLDVRDDTLARFSANRWRKAYRSLRPLTNPTPSNPSEPSTLSLDTRAEIFSKNLVRKWINDPSNVRLLRVAFDVTPQPSLLEVVLDLVRPHLSGRSNDAVRRVCFYTISELFRAAATETGIVRDPDELPASADRSGYRTSLANFAEELLHSARRIPWYVQQQALLFLAFCQRPIQVRGQREPLLAKYKELHLLLLGELPRRPQERHIALALVIAHATGDIKRAGDIIWRMLDHVNWSTGHRLLDMVLSENRQASMHLWSRADPQTREVWESRFRAFGYLQHNVFSSTQTTANANESFKLLDVIAAPESPLRHEIGALIFLRELIVVRRQVPGGMLTSDRVELQCKDWRYLNSEIGSQPGWLRITLTAVSEFEDPRYVIPAWVEERDRWKVELGQILRATLLGDNDFTRSYLAQQRHPVDVRYSGIRSAWYKRRYALFNGRDAIGPEWLPVTPWVMNLTSSLLMIPGQLRPHRLLRLKDNITGEQLIQVIDNRLAELFTIFGRASNTAVYEVPITLSKPSLRLGHLRFAIVQSVIPRFGDYGAADLQLLNPTFRRRQRIHLRAVLAGLQKMLEVRQTHMSTPQGIDIAVLPELHVHIDDIRPIVHRFIDQTHCIVFCGLVFHPPYAGSQNLINSGLWIIPSRLGTGRSFIHIEQGKFHMTSFERTQGIQPFRPCQWVIKYVDASAPTVALWKLSGSICYDATDLRIAADLRNVTDGFVVPALNKDVGSFDTMVAALHYHMFQHVILVNTGEFGGSSVQAPYKEQYHRTILHHHGSDQATVGFFEVDLNTYRNSHFITGLVPGAAAVPAPTGTRELKSPPAGWSPR